MFRLLKRIFRPNIQPMNIITINAKNILHNLHYLQSLNKEVEVFPVLKSNAYGHGLEQITKILNKTDVPYLAVDSFPEYSLINKISKKNILLLWETLPENYRKFDIKRTTFCVYNRSTVKALWKLHKTLKVHIFLNTWMNREWVTWENLEEFLELLKQYPKIKVEWVMSHFHSADNLWDVSMQLQIQAFKKMYYKILDYGHACKYRHIANSAGILKLEDTFFNACRPWLALYGYNPLNHEDEKFDKWRKLRPALSITSRVVWIQDVWPGEWVSYNTQYHAEDHKEEIGLVPFGYMEWLPRISSGKIKFKIGRHYYNQVGTICMNLCSIKIEDHMHVWDEVEVISENIKSENNIYKLAEVSGMIVYEVLVNLDRGIRREVD